MGEQLTASQWLGRFGDALASGEVDRVTGLFGDECYWRDLISMTWNIHTSEGRGQIGDMLTGIEPGAWPTDLETTIRGRTRNCLSGLVWTAL